MGNAKLRDQFEELKRLYAEHAKNQSEEDFKVKNKLRTELLDLLP